MSLKIENSRRNDESRPVCVGLEVCVGYAMFTLKKLECSIKSWLACAWKIHRRGQNSKTYFHNFILCYTRYMKVSDQINLHDLV